MITTIPSPVLVPAEPVFSEPEQLALAGFLASASGLTRPPLRSFGHTASATRPRANGCSGTGLKKH